MLTFGACDVELNPPGPAQLKVTPEVVDDPLIVTAVVVQVSDPLLVAVTFGTVPFKLTVVVAIVLHPLVGLVTVRV